DDHSRLAYAELLPGQDADNCVRFLERALAWYREPRRHGRAGPDRQRQGIPLTRLERGRTARTAQAPLHPHLPAAHERQSRAPDPNPAPRVGLRTQLPHKQPPRTRPPRLPTLVQQTPTAQRARRPTTDQPRLTPPWSRQLANELEAGVRAKPPPDLCRRAA